LATKRNRNEKFHHEIKRKSLLKKTIYLSFNDEDEGDVYIRRLEALLDEGKVPTEFLDNDYAISTLSDAIDSYLSLVDVPASDVNILELSRKRYGQASLSKIDYR
jgi:hypothetical protein